MDQLTTTDACSYLHKSLTKKEWGGFRFIISNLLTNAKILFVFNPSEQHKADIEWNFPQVHREEWRQKYEFTKKKRDKNTHSCVSVSS